MDADGIVRPIDQSGRVVLPKDYLRELGIRNGESVLLACQGEEIHIRRYLTFWQLPFSVKVMMQTYCHTYVQPAALCDQTEVRVANGISITPRTELTPAMREVITRMEEQTGEEPLPMISAACDTPVRAVFPIAKGVEAFGGLVLFQTASELPLEGTRLFVRILTDLISSEH